MGNDRCLIGNWIICRRKRWREWMNRVEAAIFAASEPVTRNALARVVGAGCNIDLFAVAGGWKHLTWPAYADAIRGAVGGSEKAVGLTQSEELVLMCIAYFQPITRGELSSFFGRKFRAI